MSLFSIRIYYIFIFLIQNKLLNYIYSKQLQQKSKLKTKKM